METKLKNKSLLDWEYFWFRKLFKQELENFKLEDTEETDSLFHDFLLECLEKDNYIRYYKKVLKFRLIDFKSNLKEDENLEDLFDFTEEKVSYEFSFPLWKDIYLVLSKILNKEEYKLIKLKLEGYTNKEI